MVQPFLQSVSSKRLKPGVQTEGCTWMFTAPRVAVPKRRKAPDAHQQRGRPPGGLVLGRGERAEAPAQAPAQAPAGEPERPELREGCQTQRASAV